jgi:cytidine deaminase
MDIGPNTKSMLRARAREALTNAYAPYSKFRVGAAVLTEQGNVHVGTNVENSSYGLTICAERSAIFAAVAAEGEAMRVAALAVACEQPGNCSPCGACRQVMFEFGPNAIVLFEGPRGPTEMTATELLPKGFRLR